MMKLLAKFAAFFVVLALLPAIGAVFLIGLHEQLSTTRKRRW